MNEGAYALLGVALTSLFVLINKLIDPIWNRWILRPDQRRDELVGLQDCFLDWHTSALKLVATAGAALETSGTLEEIRELTMTSRLKANQVQILASRLKDDDIREALDSVIETDMALQTALWVKIKANTSLDPEWFDTYSRPLDEKVNAFIDVTGDAIRRI